MKNFLFKLWNFWPPFFGAGIKIESVSTDMLKIRIRLKKRFWNRNLVGTAYGGSIYSMVDPFYMAMLLSHLKKEFVIWDKSSFVRFRKPGTTDLIADFELTQKDLDDIRERMKAEEKFEWERMVHVKDPQGNVIAEVNKVIHIRRKIA